MHRSAPCIVYLLSLYSVSISAFFITPNSRHQIHFLDAAPKYRQSKAIRKGITSKADVEDDDKDDKPIKNESLFRLAKLSLEDFKWRQAIFKTSEADRKVEESLARMMGDEAAYLRPMDASTEKIGPLGLLEKSSVDWLRNVIEEEARRAEKIVGLGGMMVRPIESAAPDGELGPLGMIEKRFVDFLENIRDSERERSRTRTLRPKDMDESKRGPLGEAELKAVETLKEVLESEKLRAEQSKVRDQLVRPIDIPGPIGDFEMAVLEVVKAEKQRALEKEENPGSFMIRPKDSKVKGPLGELEQQAVEAVKRLTDEEKERLRNIQRFLDEKRPMEQDKKSLLGIIETLAVGIVRAPILIFQILARIKELLDSETLSEEDAKVVRQMELMETAKQKNKTDEL